MPKQKDFDMNLLRVFVSVCQTGSFTKAAEELDLTQSSVSNAIRRLKESLGRELFVRSGRGIEMTNYGASLFKQVEPSIMVLTNVGDEGEAFDPKTSKRTFSIYALESVLPRLQIRLKALLKESDITVTLRELPSNEEEIIDALMLEKVDLALDVMKPRQSSLRSMVVSEDKICCIARCGHPRISGTITRDRFFEEDHAFLNIRRFKQTITDYLAEEALPNRKMGSEHTSMMGMMACVAQSDVIGINSVRLISQYKESFGLQLLDVPFPVRATKIHMLWATKFENNKANQWLRQLIITAEQG
ncbi:MULTISPECIES: LysR family transcriptional regulator [Aliivibrio]|uniref:LysR family transcriptional regulator n=1 Tax=Aliivibrio finisterrensis TaxID=511998 RepID=A0A4Q5KX10_9GAMM|nr:MULTISPECIES: LysR family transcriptional regulator [Aliivibrio]MDD9178109.1 LysR family transcriptional regulator [Aliivibrio sp. A6]RYU53606.1 LysR family transcriptional regulator [Aliivibrio finisterrensis]RYU54270.1 LysR family transcriptional regulator [Aliivibrio finisterrensis]RYU59250.1 LysR family transcriptional regulator [Aliivibrio finisterrensis]RYU66051.1 LysR family transcriptional regulator [Aliivibrio finisterrensis]